MGGVRARCVVTPIPTPAPGPAGLSGPGSCTYFGPIRKNCLLLRLRSWPQTLRLRSQSPVARSTLCKDFSLAFSPHQPVFSQLYEAGTDVQPAPLPLSRGRCPPAPSWASRLCSPGERGRFLGMKARATESFHLIPGMPGSLWPPCIFVPCFLGDPHSSSLADAKRVRAGLGEWSPNSG